MAYDEPEEPFHERGIDPKMRSPRDAVGEHLALAIAVPEGTREAPFLRSDLGRQ